MRPLILWSCSVEQRGVVQLNEPTDFSRNDVNEYYTFHAGIDFGLKSDYTSVVVQAITAEPPETLVEPLGEPSSESSDDSSDEEPMWMPKLALIDQVRGDRGESMLDLVNRTCATLDKVHLTSITTDGTRDPTASDVLQRKYGVVEAVRFSNNLKNQLWKDTLYFTASKDGYPWPRLSRNTKRGALVSKLQTQLSTEQIIVGDSNAVKFKHPTAHNDLLHAFNLSCYGIRKYQARNHASLIIEKPRGQLRYEQSKLLKPLIMQKLDGDDRL